MLSRVADSIYWMARYVERAENLARFIDVTMNMQLDQSVAPQNGWEPLVLTTGDSEYFQEHYEAINAENVVQFLAFDRDYPNSILSSLGIARENARTVREAISSEAWEQLNSFYHHVKGAANTPMSPDQLTDFFQTVKEYSHLFHGIVDATMTRNKGWHFANLGRLLERADKTSRLIDVKYFLLLPHLQDVGTTIDDLQWSYLLRSVSGFEMYRKRFHSISIHRVAEFLILDDQFPRAIRFCIDNADWSLHQISGTPVGTFKNSAEQQMGRLKAKLAFTDVDDIIDNGMHEFIDGFQVDANSVSKAIFETFFALRPVEAMQEQRQFQYS
ncbi:MAG: alpha-E domain-containing protein [Planctomycetaceae bacterium]|nr:alpha-E domain-containing protein [Planctomycetaceae bacterium]